VNEPKSNQALNKALQLLSKRSYSQGILTQKLREKEFPDEEIRLAIKKLVDLNFINDLRYSENMVREYSSLKRYGSYRIKLKLKEKLIPKDIISQVLGLIKEEDEEKNILELAQKQLTKNKNLSREKIINRTLGFLIRRGYSYEKSRRAVNELLR